MSFQIFGYEGLSPHGTCLLWLSQLFWTHAIADGFIAAAYYSISFSLLRLIKRRKERLFRWCGGLFAAFIVACATSHVMDIWTLWRPDYGAQALVKVCVAVISVVTAVVLWPLLPRLLALPSIARLEATNSALNSEIAERRQAEAALARYARDLEASNAHLAHTLEYLDLARRQLMQSEKMASLGGLVAGVAHEINTPIGNGITVATSLAELGKRFRGNMEGDALKRSILEAFADDVDEAARLLASNLETAAALIQSFKQVAADQTSSQRRHFDLRETVDENMAAVGPRFRHTAHKVAVDIPPGIVMDSYPGPLGQVLTNLVTNSLLHAFEGKEEGHITLHGRHHAGGRLELVYSDDGIGIAPEFHERVFEPFYTTRHGQGGTGLGLHVVYNIVTNVLGGNITLESAPGDGVRFVMDLPLTAPTLARSKEHERLANGWKVPPPTRTPPREGEGALLLPSP